VAITFACIAIESEQLVTRAEMEERIEELRPLADEFKHLQLCAYMIDEGRHGDRCQGGLYAVEARTMMADRTASECLSTVVNSSPEWLDQGVCQNCALTVASKSLNVDRNTVEKRLGRSSGQVLHS
jgi:hypothetical protein